MTRESSNSFTDMLEKMPSIDALTVIVLALDAYILYTQLDYYNRESVFTISTEPHILGLQATVALVVIYALEFIHDRHGSDSSGPLGH